MTTSHDQDSYQENFSSEEESVNLSSDETQPLDSELDEIQPELSEKSSCTDAPSPDEVLKKHSLGGMYRNWFLDYASYVILERAVPHIEDGLKPVQRRVLYAMHLMENGTLHKVAKIVGATMAYHPHGDASINDALVQLGQKNFLIDTQGNWGNIYTGDAAAAGRYIEAKLSDFAIDTLFGDKITPWKKSYDGKEREPVYLPTRFPLLLAQGAEGIAVGLACKILPHNPIELLEAACLYLRNKPFELYPDFPTGGLIDVERYNDGRRGGSIKSRARIERIEDRVLSIKDLPFGKTTSSLIESILKANEKGKIKIKRVDDMTAEEADIRITLPSGVSADKTIDGLYAFTDCEVSIWPNACVIRDNKPEFMSVSDLLTYSTDQTKELLRQDLQWQLSEKQDHFLMASLERIFIEHRIYKDKEFEQAADEKEALEHVHQRLRPLVEGLLLRPIMQEDLKKLLEIRMARILKFNLAKHEEYMLRLQSEMDRQQYHLDHIVDYTIQYYQSLLSTYGQGWQRRTRITRFGTIEATKVAEANQKLYIDREGGFVGTGLKGAEYICDCSEIDDFIIFFRKGTYWVSKVEEKKFVGREEVVHVARYQRGDTRTIYNVVYRDGKSGPYYIKRFDVSSCVRDRVYDCTLGEPQSRIEYFSANPNGEAEIISYKYPIREGNRKNGQAEQKRTAQLDFSKIFIRNRTARGNLVTRRRMSAVSLHSKGATTLGGRKVWYDPDVNRLNYNGQGTLLGEFDADDRILVLFESGEAYTTGFEESNHFSTHPQVIEKFDPDKVWTIAYLDSQRNQTYLKRCTFPDQPKPFAMAGEENKLLFFTDKLEPVLRITFGGADHYRPALEVEAGSFIAVKSVYAKGKRLSLYTVQAVELLRFQEPIVEESEEDEAILEEEQNTPNREQSKDTVLATGKRDDDLEDKMPQHTPAKIPQVEQQDDLF